MKKLLILVVLSISTFACNSNSEKQHSKESHQAEAYACPMKCESEKTYKEKGTCPVCKMDLKKI